MKRIAVLGSTGSIGQNALKVIARFPDKFRVTALSANSDIDTLYRQIKCFKPAMVCVADKDKTFSLERRSGIKTKFFSGPEGLLELAGQKNIDTVVLAISGSGALLPLLEAIENKKEIALANKEALVMAGPMIRQKAVENKVRIIPIDSEQSAIWQCLDGQDKDKLAKIYLTASGGPFKDWKKKEFKKISLKVALRHPRWKMGKKITVDSATMMNKGLEVLEAMYLFGVEADKIKVVIHPEAIVHSMVEFVDGIILAQLSVTDMRIPIQYALSYPERLASRLKRLDFAALKLLSFAKADFEKFPCLALAYRAAHTGGTMPAVLNAANEESVTAFLGRRLDFISIPKVIGRVMDKHRCAKNPELKQILASDSWARREAEKAIGKINN
jgi:1-deoxy-D-xylulose-5-phosphate reductoisomerase